MGFFSFFKKSKEPEVKVKNEFSHSLSTVKPDNDLFICYDEVFFNEMKNVEGFSLSELKDINSIVKNGEGGFLNMGSYHKKVYEDFFKGRKWTWLEYEKWNDICEKMGSYPVSFPIKQTIKDNEINLDNILSSVKVAELKEILKTEKFEYTDKSKKNDLINIVKMIPNIKNNSVVIEAIEKIQEKEGYTLYTLLMRTIHFRANSLHNQKRESKLGIKKHELLIIHNEDKVFIDMALSKNPNALPPFFPSDVTSFRPIIEF